ncbi:MAG: molybdenum cofactor guanylyltransferase MobA [Rhodospirillaceae bacterium]|jgi:molybdenum cofactor guanylyltransferase|nr:molybdenum cofactor guanylyltransferase MobA [Rhodospirillaceae bacterium]MBT4589154.1 molybdenum cofactor guanylyltransferase MobA [Rhodospirillaceae bacterium]MBT4938021.1 molybdenum cofactor guanylyltransferase MobA [Rhodospirillaceae bacterium]MBT5940473.1 molybdenum cofactor guanylyltransferase MobA [Rhodospirillaceae bacterium]MBT7268507.1 molybdenum cofactor guanylyltransferase MobA [Rhodospirillaceae bacterium]
MSKNSDSSTGQKVAGVILAGGQSRRFGVGDKFLKELDGKMLIEYVVERANFEVGNLIINSNSDASLFKAFDLPVVADSIKGYAGPLAGILTAMEWVRDHVPDCKWLVSFPSDAPFVPLGYVEKMLACAEREGAEIVCAASAGRTHPVCALWQVDLASDLRKAMVDEEMRKIDLWTQRYRLSVLEFSDQPHDPFFNINRPEDLELAEQISQNLAG